MMMAMMASNGIALFIYHSIRCQLVFNCFWMIDFDFCFRGELSAETAKIGDVRGDCMRYAVPLQPFCNPLIHPRLLHISLCDCDV